MFSKYLISLSRLWKFHLRVFFSSTSDNPKWAAAAAVCVGVPNRPAKRPVGLPPGRRLSLGRQRQRQAQEGHDAQGRLLRPAAQRTRAPIPAAEVHQQTRQEEAGRETWTQRLAGQLTISLFFILKVFEKSIHFNWYITLKNSFF